jgi:hypothetical protein
MGVSQAYSWVLWQKQGGDGAGRIQAKIGRRRGVCGITWVNPIKNALKNKQKTANIEKCGKTYRITLSGGFKEDGTRVRKSTTLTQPPCVRCVWGVSWRRRVLERRFQACQAHKGTSGTGNNGVFGFSRRRKPAFDRLQA